MGVTYEKLPDNRRIAVTECALARLGAPSTRNLASWLLWEQLVADACLEHRYPDLERPRSHARIRRETRQALAGRVLDLAHDTPPGFWAAEARAVALSYAPTPKGAV